MTTRYPDPAFEILDASFARYRLNAAHVEVLGTGLRWAEGPVWFGDQRCLFLSDIPNDRILRWSEETGALTEFRKPSHNSNGLTRDRRGRLIACEHRGRRVTRTEHDGSITVLASHLEGKRLNSPNDVVVKSDGSVWFTDPPFGLLGFYEGERAPQELPTNVYRVDGTTLEIACVAEGIVRPNGLAFSPDESLLYVVESNAAGRTIRVFDVTADGSGLANGRIFYRCEPEETPDGFRLDTDGNLWCGWGMGEGQDGVVVFNPEGRKIGRIRLPIRCANLAFGGRHRNRLFLAASTMLMAVYVDAQGATWPG
jgi:gluconolactonase